MNRLTKYIIQLCLIALPLLLASFQSCQKETLEPQEEVQTTESVKHEIKNVVIVVIDGPRYSETWGDTSYKYMPRMGKELYKRGALFTKFYNKGVTYTNPGHTAIATGVHQQVENNGNELPQYPSLLQVWLKHSGKPSSAAWLITSKGKLKVIGNTQHPEWKDKFLPSTNCGDHGSGNGYRKDSLTMIEVRRVLQDHKPTMTLINFREPDVSGHINSWKGYLKGISDTDRYVYEIWNLIQNSDHYKDRTLLLVTNDHGRHSDGMYDGFVSHGDDCDGCRHISLFALSPNFTKKTTINTEYDQRDISVTVAKLLGFTMPHAQGKLIKEIY